MGNKHAEVTTSPLPKNSKAIELAKLQLYSNAHLEFENTSGLITRAKALTEVMDKHIQNMDPKSMQNTRKYATVLFQLTSAFIAHDILNVAIDFQSTASALRGTDLFERLEVDFISMNFILHQFLDLFSLCTTYFRVCDVKDDHRQINQLSRMHDLIVRQLDDLQHSAARFVDSFTAAMGSATASSSITTHVSKAIKRAGLWSSLMKYVSRFIHSGPVQSTLSALTSQQSLDVMHWIFRSSRLFIPGFIPDTLDAVLTTMLESIPSNSQKAILPANEPPVPPGEFGTLSRLQRSSAKHSQF